MPEPTPGLGQDSREETAVPSTGMAIVSPSLRLKRLLWRAVHGVFYLGVRPLAQRVPFRTLDRLGGVLAIPMGLLLVVFGAHHRRRYLRQLGEPATGLPLIRYCVREVRARLRETFGYLRPDVPIQVRPGAAAWAELDGASVLVSWSAFGTIRMGIWTTETRCRFVRIPFSGEGGALPSEVPDVTQSVKTAVYAKVPRPQIAQASLDVQQSQGARVEQEMQAFMAANGGGQGGVQN